MTAVPSWKSAPPSHAHRIRSWLVHPGSLTRRLQAHCRKLEVRVLRQSDGLPTVDESAALGDRRRRRVLVREVELVTDGRVAVRARSVLHPEDLKGAWRPLRTLGNRSLAELLFSDARVKREPLRFARIGKLPARRSVFRLRGRPLLVMEMFVEPPGAGAKK